MPEGLKTALRVLVGAGLVTLWAGARHQREGEGMALLLVPVLLFGVLQLFEALATYDGPTLPRRSFAFRELAAAGFAVGLTAIAYLSDAESEDELTPLARTVLLVLLTAGAHSFVASSEAGVRRPLVIVHAGLALLVGVAVSVVLARRPGATGDQVVAAPVLALVAGMATLPTLWRGRRAVARWKEFDRSLYDRVRSAQLGEGDDAVLRLLRPGADDAVYSRGGDDEAVVVPRGLGPRFEVGVGHGVLFVRPRFATATRGGGEGYRGATTYERLVECVRATPLGPLPLPPPPRRPLNPLVLEAMLLGVVGAYAFFGVSALLWVFSA